MTPNPHPAAPARGNGGGGGWVNSDGDIASHATRRTSGTPVSVRSAHCDGYGKTKARDILTVRCIDGVTRHGNLEEQHPPPAPRRPTGRLGVHRRSVSNDRNHTIAFTKPARFPPQTPLSQIRHTLSDPDCVNCIGKRSQVQTGRDSVGRLCYMEYGVLEWPCGGPRRRHATRWVGSSHGRGCHLCPADPRRDLVVSGTPKA